MDLMGLLTADWWNGVSGILTTITSGTVVTALIGWWRDRHRIHDGIMRMETERDGDHVARLRFRNVGESEVLPHMIFTRNLTLKRSLEPFPGGIMPGEQLIVEVDRSDKNADIVLVYTTARNTRLVRIMRFRPEHPQDWIFMPERYEKPPKSIRRKIPYRGNPPLFTETGLTTEYRTVLMRRPGDDQKALRWLTMSLTYGEGYRLYVV